MMNPYNVDNPFIKILSDLYLKLRANCSRQSSNILKQNIIIVIVSILGLLVTRELVIVLFIPIYLLISFGLFKLTLNNIPFKFIEEIYNGDEFKVQTINDEKIFNLLSIMWKGEGMLLLLSNILTVVFCFIIIFIFFVMALSFYAYIYNMIIS